MNKNKKKIFIFLIILALIVILLTLLKNNFKTPKVVSINKNAEIILTYDEYEAIFKYLVENLDVRNLELKASTLGDNVTLVNKELTFNKREYLTIDGTIDNDIKPTDEQLVLESNDGKKNITIAILYTNNFMESNLVGYVNNKGFDNLNEQLVNGSLFATLTFKNLIINVNQVAIDKFDIDLTNEILQSIIETLKKF